MNRLHETAAVAALLVGWSATVQAGVTVTVQQVGNDVVVTGDGSIDLSTANPLPSASEPGNIAENKLVLGVGAADVYLMQFEVVGTGCHFGTAGISAFADSGTGDLHGFFASGNLFLFVPLGYSSGQPLAGSSTYVGETLDSLGLVPGVYRWEWYRDDFVQTDFFEIEVLGPAVGACCVNEGCVEITETSCDVIGGQYFGDSVACSAVSCPTVPVPGACCINGACVQLSSADCASVGGMYNGDDTDCSSVVCDPSCPADITDSKGGGPDGVVNLFDLLAMLDAWGSCLP